MALQTVQGPSHMTIACHLYNIMEFGGENQVVYSEWIFFFFYSFLSFFPFSFLFLFALSFLTGFLGAFALGYYNKARSEAPFLVCSGILLFCCFCVFLFVCLVYCRLRILYAARVLPGGSFPLSLTCKFSGA